MINIEAVNIDVSIEEGSSFWNCTVEIANVSDFILFKPNDTFTINLLGELYNFYVDNISVNRNTNYEITAIITGIGIGADLDQPRKELISKTWEVSEFAQTIVNELLEGRVDNWSLIDWEIPAFVLSAEASSRIDLSKRIVEAAGGVLEGLPNGNFQVRHLFPVSPKDYEITAEDHTFDESLNVFGAQYSYQNNKYIDWVRIRDSDDDGIQDSIEFESDENNSLAGTLHVYPVPWREDVSVRHTGGSGITLKLLGVVTRQEEETIEIFEGEGSVKYPIISIDSIEWSGVNLTDVIHDYYSNDVKTTHPDKVYTMVKLKYTTKSIDYSTSTSSEKDVQYLVVDTVNCPNE